MKFVIDDLYGDQIQVNPLASGGIVPKVGISFLDKDSGAVIVMNLDDRTAADLKKAINQSLKESVRMG